MVERLPSTLRTYQLLTAAAAPLAPRLVNWRLRHGKEDPARLTERYGESKLRRPEGPLIWLHGASVGELFAVIPLIERIRARNFSMLVTTGTITSAGVAEQRLPAGVVHQYAPLDTPRFVTRFFDHWQPNLGIIVESDLWPCQIVEASRRAMPLILVNARLSVRSFHRWRRMPGTIAALLHRLDLCLAQSLADAERFAALGAPRISTTGNLKLDIPDPPASAVKLDALRHAVGKRTVIAATSTHAGEEAAMIDAHRRLRSSFPGLLTIIAPRHPERGRGIADIAVSAGLKAAQRSRGDLPNKSTDIYVVDTIGELGLVYRLAPIVFVGGSLVKHGGQNPVEPVKLGAAILHGPHIGNFSEIYGTLDASGGAVQVADAGKLTVRIGAWLTDAQARQKVVDAATQTVVRLGGALERTLAALEPYLMQLQLEQRADDVINAAANAAIESEQTVEAPPASAARRDKPASKRPRDA